MAIVRKANFGIRNETIQKVFGNNSRQMSRTLFAETMSFPRARPTKRVSPPFISSIRFSDKITLEFARPTGSIKRSRKSRQMMLREPFRKIYLTVMFEKQDP